MTDPDGNRENDTRRIRRASVKDATLILPVIEAAFPAWPAMPIDVSPLEHLIWKMTGPANAPRHPHTIVLLGDTVVAVEVRWLAHAQIGDQVIPFDRGVDLAVDPNYQGRGLARAIFDDDDDRNVPLGDLVRWDTPSTDAKVQHLDVGDTVRRELRIWTRTFDSRAFAGAHLRAGFPHVLAAAARAARSQLRPRRGRTASRYVVRPLTQFDRQSDALWERTRTEFDIARVRDAALMNWRYLDPRSGRARAMAVFDPAGQMVGYGVAKPDRRDAQLAELVVDPRHAAAGVQLLEAIAADARATGARTLTCWLPPRHPAERALRAAAFLDTGRVRDLTIDMTWMAGAPAAIDCIRDPHARLHITIGDFDFV